jgi:plasmid stabilization system protein ParE
MRAEQTVNEMVEEVLLRQAQVRAQRTAQPLEEALESILETPAGRQLEELRSGPHQHEEARYWQANLLFERVSESRQDILYSSGRLGRG